MVVKLVFVAGARPNFPKIAALLRALRGNDRFESRLVHTGQHYDQALSEVFFQDLDIRRPDVELRVGSTSHAVQTAEILKGFEGVLEREQPQAVVVVGDVNSTVACALATCKFCLNEPFRFRGEVRRRPVVIHVEAGLRSFDEDMPEEINRRLTDVVSEVLFVSEPAGMENLAREGVPAGRAVLVGNVMIDTMLRTKDQALRSDVLERLGVEAKGFSLLTLHRPANVDNQHVLRGILGTLDDIARHTPVIFPVHPRAKRAIGGTGIELHESRWMITEPMGYLDFLKLEASAQFVMTDSGGIQEETTVLGTPCLTLRDNTERPITIAEGTNVLAGTRPETILAAYHRMKRHPPRARAPRLWDGQAASRIVESLDAAFCYDGTVRRTRELR